MLVMCLGCNGIEAEQDMKFGVNEDSSKYFRFECITIYSRNGRKWPKNLWEHGSIYCDMKFAKEIDTTSMKNSVSAERQNNSNINQF